MYCPSCEHRLEAGVQTCDLCGFSLSRVDKEFRKFPIMKEQVTDMTHLLRVADRELVQVAIDHFEEKFPQLFPAFYVTELPGDSLLTEFATWLVNRAEIDVEGELRNNENGIFFVIDLKQEQFTVSVGYYAEHFLPENDLTAVLKVMAPDLKAHHLAEAMVKGVNELQTSLRKNHRALKRLKGGAQLSQ